MKINVKMLDEFEVYSDIKIDSSKLDGKIHKHRSGRDFTDEEIKNLKASKLSPEAAKKASNDEILAKKKASEDAIAAKKIAANG